MTATIRVYDFPSEEARNEAVTEKDATKLGTYLGEVSTEQELNKVFNKGKGFKGYFQKGIVVNYSVAMIIIGSRIDKRSKEKELEAPEERLP